MRLADSLSLAVRAVTAQRLRSFLTLLGIAVGIASVILLTSIGEGIHRFVLGEFSQFGTNNISVMPGKTKTGGAPSGLPSSARPLTLEDAKSLERLPHVIAVTPNIRGNAEVEGNGRTRRTLVYGVTSQSQKVFKRRCAAASSCHPTMPGAPAPSSCSAPRSRTNCSVPTARLASACASAACTSASSASHA